MASLMGRGIGLLGIRICRRIMESLKPLGSKPERESNRSSTHSGLHSLRQTEAEWPRPWAWFTRAGLRPYIVY